MHYVIPYKDDTFYYGVTDLLRCIDYNWEVNGDENAILVPLHDDNFIRQYQCENLMYLQCIVYNEIGIIERMKELKEDD